MKIKSLLLLAAFAVSAVPAFAGVTEDLDPSTDIRFEVRDADQVKPGELAFINVVFVNPTVEYGAVQCSFDYPEGWTAEKFSQKDAGIGTKPNKLYAQLIPEGRLDEYYDEETGEGRTAFGIMGNVSDDASFIFAIYDSDATGKKIPVGEDAVAVIAVKVPDGAAGDYTFTVRDIWISTGIPGGVGDGGIEDFTFTITVPTAVNDVNVNKAVAGVKYYNLAGVESDQPFDGVNVVVTTYTDGTKAAAKVIK